MYYLRWEQPTTLQAWNDAGMTCDTALSYAGLPRFRCGSCFEYPVFNAVRHEMLNIRVRLFIAMKCTVTSERYIGLGYTNATLAQFEFLKNMSEGWKVFYSALA